MERVFFHSTQQSNMAEGNPREPDQAYASVWRRYRLFVDAERLTGNLPDGEKYITRANVDRYFSQIVRHLTVSPVTAYRHATAIQWYATNREYYAEANQFLVRNGVNSEVQRALNDQANNYAEAYVLALHDAHANLPTDVLTKGDHRKVMQHVLTNNLQCYQSFAVSWTVCHATFLRLDSLRKMRLCDLRADHAHGPCEDGPNATILSFILQPYQHKDDAVGGNQATQREQEGGGNTRAPNSYKKRVVGMYRHQNIDQCGTSQTAMSLFLRLRRNHQVSFIVPADGQNRPSWQRELILNDWSANRSPYTTYTRVLQACNVSFNKVTHLRSAGMEYASAQGELPADVLATMSKHRGDRIFQCYMTELHPPVMRVMAGFKSDDPYFVARTQIEPPFSAEEATTLCFPLIGLWKEEQASPNGDKDKSAKNFLADVLPFLSRVILQDGPYWLRQYPGHPYTRALFSAMPPAYERWARQALIEADRLVANRNVNNIENVNDGARNAFEHMTRSNEALTEEIRRLQAEMREQAAAAQQANQQQVQQIAELQRESQRTQNTLLGLLQWLTQNHGQQQPGQQQEQQLQDLQRQALQQQQEQRRLQQQELRRQEAARRQNVNDALRGIPRLAETPSRLARSMVALLQEWNDLHLERLAPPAQRRGWPRAKNMMYCKWQYLYKTIKSRAERGAFRPAIGDFQQRLIAAAESYDEERGNRTMDQFRASLKRIDLENGQARRRRRRHEGI